MNWKNYNEVKPETGREVLAYHPSWLDDDSNPHGIRIGFQCDDDFVSARWSNYQDCYVTISHAECDEEDNLSLIDEEFLTSIEPEKWIELTPLTDLL